MSRSKKKTLSERLEEEILQKVGTGFSASAYSRTELFNYFCVARRGSVRQVYSAKELDRVISGMLENGKLEDHGGDFFSQPRPKETTVES